MHGDIMYLTQTSTFRNASLGIPNANGAPSGHNTNVIYQHIHDQASKRISTLDYLRKAHEGRIYWFNTLLFTKSDLPRLPSHDSRKLARRATNYLLLGFSLPTILDLNSQSPADYLRALNALLIEFETYQSVHPPDGSGPSSLSRGRIPQMLKRATTVGVGGKARRTSSAADLGWAGLGGGGGGGAGADGASGSAGAGSSDASFLAAAGASLAIPAGEQDLIPGEGYAHLLTPSLPFDPDFFETFATLCDVLIDCYTKVMNLVGSPEACGPGVADLFAKADTRLRKIIVAGMVREFEDVSRQGIKSEMAGVGKVVLGGLM